MVTNEYELTVTAFKNEEEYNNYINLSNKIDTFCTQAKILETVAKSNKYVEATMDFCDTNGDIQNSIKLFSPALNDTNTEREIFATIASKAVRLGTETTFEAGGTRLGTSVGTTLVGLGAGTPPAWIMGISTGGSFYLGGKYIGIAVGHYAEKYSYDKFLEFYDKYLKQTDINNKVDTPIEIVNTEKNKSTLFEQNKETNQLEPIFEKDLVTQKIMILKAGQTISHIAQDTPYSSTELLEYNNLTLEEAKNLPLGYEVKIPNDTQNIQTTNQEKIFDEKLDTFKDFAKVFMQDTEAKEDIEKLQNEIENIKQKENLNEKIKSLENLDFKDFTSNTYIDKIFSNNKEKIIEDSTTFQENTNNNTEYKKYDYMQTNINTSQNSNSSIQMMN